MLYRTKHESVREIVSAATYKWHVLSAWHHTSMVACLRVCQMPRKLMMQRMKPAAAAHIATVDFKTASSCNIPAPYASIPNTRYREKLVVCTCEHGLVHIYRHTHHSPSTCTGLSELYAQFPLKSR